MALNRVPPFVSGGDVWQQAGSCRGLDPELFFVESQRGTVRDEHVASAKAICAQCPVKQSCREHGLNTQEAYGIWGGLTRKERQATLRWRRWNAPGDGSSSSPLSASARGNA